MKDPLSSFLKSKYDISPEIKALEGHVDKNYLLFINSVPEYVLKLSLDLTARVEWQQRLWTALSFRTKDAVALMLGYSFDESLFFGYAYDIGISELRKYNTGSHEVMIGYRFNEIK